ncbi:TIGR00266 family protein [Desulfobacter vibrioformis]|uniref:TIGR00266 family protein n=1 Tax=Desulfobacter vibrioformis TaxID=34031 RepID=UPI000B0182BB
MMRCHEVDYEIFGDDMQAVEVELDPGETVIAEAGAMNWMEQGIAFEAKMGDGSEADKGLMGKLFSAGKRALTGESLFLTHFTNQAHDKKRVAFSAPYPGKIIPVDMAAIGGHLICQKDAFLCAALGTKVSIAFNRKLGAGFFGGEGFILQRLEGDGMAFIHAGGTIVKKELNGQRLMVDTGCIVAFSQGVEYDIQRAGGLKSMFFGGEGLFLATLEGHGSVYLQSLPFSRLADRIISHAPSAGGSSKGEGSVLGGLGRLMDGD